LPRYPPIAPPPSFRRAPIVLDPALAATIRTPPRLDSFSDDAFFDDHYSDEGFPAQSSGNPYLDDHFSDEHFSSDLFVTADPFVTNDPFMTQGMRSVDRTYNPPVPPIPDLPAPAPFAPLDDTPPPRLLADVEPTPPAVEEPTPRHLAPWLRTLVWVLAIVGLGWAVTMTGFGLVMNQSYSDRVLPGTILAGHDISGVTRSYLPTLLGSLSSDIKVGITAGGETLTATGTDLGIALDEAAITAVVLPDHHPLLWPFRTPEPVPLAVTVDTYQFNAWLYENFPDSFVAPVIAGVKFNAETGLFVTTAAADGTGVAAHEIEAIIAGLANSEDPGAFTVTAQPLSMGYTTQLAEATRDWLNQRLGLTYALTTGSETIYTLSKADIAGMATIQSHPETGTTASYTETAIAQYLEQVIAPKVDRAAVDGETLINWKGETIYAKQGGTDGRTLTNLGALATSLAAALTAGEAAKPEATLAVAPHQDKTTQVPVAAPPPGVGNEHWADVNLTYQTVTLMDGSTPSAIFMISSGMPGHETPVGTFHVYSKVPSQTISGWQTEEYDGYWYDDTRWVQWFNSDFGFHTAYWHEDFGKPVSHGCINLREPDAKAVYDWLARGDAVHIHY
jgi:lipoprotein-anchoring transpeptidase ErfK/SrfK